MKTVVYRNIAFALSAALLMSGTLAAMDKEIAQDVQKAKSIRELNYDKAAKSNTPYGRKLVEACDAFQVVESQVASGKEDDQKDDQEDDQEDDREDDQEDDREDDQEDDHEDDQEDDQETVLRSAGAVARSFELFICEHNVNALSARNDPRKEEWIQKLRTQEEDAVKEGYGHIVVTKK